MSQEYLHPVLGVPLDQCCGALSEGLRRDSLRLVKEPPWLIPVIGGVAIQPSSIDTLLIAIDSSGYCDVRSEVAGGARRLAHHVLYGGSDIASSCSRAVPKVDTKRRADLCGGLASATM